MLWITDQVQFQLIFESRKGFGFPNSYRKTVPSTWTSDLKGPIGILVLVPGTKTSDEFDDHEAKSTHSIVTQFVAQ